MKKIIILFIVLLGLGLTHSCKKEAKDPVLDMNQTVKSGIISPPDGSAFVLTADEAENLINFTWSATQYNLTDLETTKYTLQMDFADSAFANAIEIVQTTQVSYEMSVGALNQKLLNYGATGGVATNMEFRVLSFINNETTYSTVISEVNTSTITPFDEAVIVKPIYLLGDGTTVGWDNVNPLEMTHLEDGKFAIVETLGGPGLFIKFLSIPGQWAPQWGTDEAGTAEAGIMVHIPDEGVPDPIAIPTPELAGDYYITADTVNLEYTVSATSAELYLIGDASQAGWDNTAGEAFTKVSPGIFNITATLNAEGGLKFLEVPGQWAPQWGTDDTGTWDAGPLVYRPEESVPDPVNIPAPSSAGLYLIELNLITMQYRISAQ